MELNKIIHAVNANKIDELRDILYSKIDSIKDIFDMYIKDHDKDHNKDPLIKYQKGFSSKRLSKSITE